MNGNPNDIFDQIENLKVEKTAKRVAVWVEKGSCYGNGTPFTPIVPLYICSNCGAMSCTLFNICPECEITMTNGKKELELLPQWLKEGDEK